MGKMHTPWKAGCGDGMWSVDHAASHAYGDAPIVDGNNVVVAIAVTSASNDKDAERRDFILEAVNSHASLVEENKRMREALEATRALVSEASATGFNWQDGDWADRLYKNNGAITKSLKGDTNA